MLISTQKKVPVKLTFLFAEYEKNVDEEKQTKISNISNYLNNAKIK